MADTIREIMLRDHGKLNALLVLYKRDFNKKTLSEFKWQLEKHTFIEEKLIFEIYLNSKESLINSLDDLIKEHKELLFLTEKLMNNKNTNISEIENLLKSHSKFEDEIFYPTLEKELDIEKKKLITDRCIGLICD